MLLLSHACPILYRYSCGVARSASWCCQTCWRMPPCSSRLGRTPRDEAEGWDTESRGQASSTPWKSSERDNFSSLALDYLPLLHGQADKDAHINTRMRALQIRERRATSPGGGDQPSAWEPMRPWHAMLHISLHVLGPCSIIGFSHTCVSQNALKYMVRICIKP